MLYYDEHNQNHQNLIYKEDWKLVRGLDYYTRTVFEIQSGDVGAQDALCGGGRYDGLVKELGGADTPGFGFVICKLYI